MEFSPSSSALGVSVVVPVHQGGQPFRSCTMALARALRPADELVVIADGETDGAWKHLPRVRSDVQTVVLERAGGPARARNVGARAARRPVLLFVDADVAVLEDAIDRVRRRFAADPDLDALVGSYDTAPADGAFVSQYRNLLHHWTHQTAGEPFETFWTGLGAVRRDAFLALGGFDESFEKPSVEDIEFGYRLRAAGGHIALDPDLQGTHLKAWRPADMVRTDVLRRAAPWTEMLLRRGVVEDNLNVDRRSRASVAALLTTGVGAWAAQRHRRLGVAVAAGGLAAFGALNAPFYRFLRRERGVSFALQAVPWHAVYYASAAAGAALGTARHTFRTVSRETTRG